MTMRSSCCCGGTLILTANDEVGDRNLGAEGATGRAFAPARRTQMRALPTGAIDLADLSHCPGASNVGLHQVWDYLNLLRKSAPLPTAAPPRPNAKRIVAPVLGKVLEPDPSLEPPSGLSAFTSTFKGSATSSM